jgi:hypothetical protein
MRTKVLIFMLALVFNVSSAMAQQPEPLAVQMVKKAKLPDQTNRTIDQALSYSGMFKKWQWSLIDEDIINGVATVGFLGLIELRGIHAAAKGIPGHESWNEGQGFGDDYQSWYAAVSPLWEDRALAVRFVVTMTERKYGDKIIPKGTVLYPKQIIRGQIFKDGTFYPEFWTIDWMKVLFESALYPRYTSILNLKAKPSLDNFLTTYNGAPTKYDNTEIGD